MVFPRLIRVQLAMLAALAAAALLYGTYHLTYERAVAALEGQARARLRIVVANLNGELDKYSFQPRLLARQPYVIDALSRPGDAAVIDRANTELALVNGVTGALATYLMDRDATTIASSNWALDASFVGKNFSYRPYFQQAIEGRPGRYYALGTTSGERGYYYSFPVRIEGRVEGVVVVKMDVSALEQTWPSETDEFVALDQSGVVFLSSEPSWLFRSFGHLDEDTRRRLEARRQYNGRELKRLNLKKEPGSPLVRLAGSIVGNSEDERIVGPEKSYVIASKVIPAGWEVVVLADASEIADRVRMSLLVAGFMIFSAVLLVVNIVQRRRRLRERLSIQEQARVRLEETVAERTSDLSLAVERLELEVAERQKAEAHLRTTQDELIQASKLAALGSLSAGLSHELNQPLTAIRNYSENARIYLERDNLQTALSNLGRIAEMSDRMARIVRNLRTYARKENVEMRPTRLIGAIRNALGLLEGEIEKSGVTVVFDHDGEDEDEDLLVQGGDVRLQQVFVNLISNAVDAMETAADKRLSIRVRADDRFVDIRLRDSGAGIDTDIIGRVFDPFVTTKDVGKGTGLGLSITYGLIKQFGGTIAARNSDEGGAEFAIRLLRAQIQREAAQ